MKCASALLLIAAFALLPGARALAQQATESAEAEKLPAPDRPARGSGFDEAIARAESALSIQERALGPDDPGVVEAINDLAVLYMSAKDYGAAEALLERVLRITTDALEPRDEPAIATATRNLGALYWEQGDLERAAQYLQQAVSIWERALGPDDPSVATSLAYLASFYRNTGDVERALRLYERAVAIWEKNPDSFHDRLADALRTLAAIHAKRSEYERAASFLKRALALEEEVRGADHLETAVALSNLASLYYDSRDYARAVPLLERALAILEGTHGPAHPDVLSAMSNLASVHVAIGDTASAVHVYERVLEIWSQDPESDPFSLAVALEDLATAYQEQGEYARSRPLFERALAIRVEIFGTESAAVARTNQMLGAVDWALGDFAGAQPLFEGALSIHRKINGPDHPTVAASAERVAAAYLALGHAEKAKPLYEEALAIRENAFEPEHRAVARSLRNLGLLHWARAEWDPAEAYLARAAEVEERQTALLLPIQFEDRARAFMEALSNTTNLILSFQSERPDQRSTTRLALTTILRRKGRELSVGAAESVALGRHLRGPERGLFKKLRVRRDELGRVILRGSKLSRTEALQDSVEKLRRDVDDLEKAAASGGVVLRSWTAPIRIESLQAKIPAGAALVELVEYQDLDPTRISTDRARGISRLAAFVLRSKGDPRWVPLGEAAAINAGVREFREVLVDPAVSPQRLRERARELYDLLAAPLEPHLEGIQTVLVAPPDGAVALVPFGALIAPDGRYWVEKYEFAYLTSGRDLLRPKFALPSQSPPLVVAAPDYDAERPAGTGAAGQAPAEFSPEIAGLHFPPVTLSQTGASDVGKLLGVAPLTGAQASDAAIKAAHAPRVLHIAADGFFLPDQHLESSMRWASILGIDSRWRAPVTKNPLRRSGLAMAGANRRTNDAGVGLLTALQIAGLDLGGTQLVAIAARGIESERAAIGQSVYALRRSVVIAGAESQFVNLWTTDHRAATELMTAYYERLLAGEGRSEALRNVQLAMLRSESRSHPFYWASFISIGDRGSIALPISPAATREVSGSP